MTLFHAKHKKAWSQSELCDHVVEEGGFAFLRKSHAGCGAPPAHRQEPAFESTLAKEKRQPLTGSPEMESRPQGGHQTATQRSGCGLERRSKEAGGWRFFMQSIKKRGRKANFATTWWRRVDSNHRSRRQQIYSLPPLATRELLHMKLWSWWTDSNPRPADYKSAALPAELHQQMGCVLVRSDVYSNRKEADCQQVKAKNVQLFLRRSMTGRGRTRAYPLRDVQRARPAAYCRRCGGELYRYDPVLWKNGGRLCPACAAEQQGLEDERANDDTD